jgi:diguanylate cyclase (GGDEF)-like protein
MLKSTKTSFILSASVLVAYALVYLPLYPALAEATNLLALVPVVVAAWLFGMRGGLLVGVLSFPINVLLMQLVGAHAVWESLNSSSEWFGQVAITVVGALVGRLHDLTELYKKQARKLEHQAFHDLLTSLPNTALFKDRLEHALTRTTRREGKVAVLFVDLDNFKLVNDTLGHHVGDELLVMVSDRLRNCRRLEDTVARLGGDEFGILLEEVASTSDAMRVAERIIEELQTSFTLDRHEMFITSSIGVAFGDSGQGSSEQLLRNAAVAMHWAKEEGKACCQLFDPSMGAQMKERLRLENDLRRALERDEFVVHYQPVVGVDSGRIMGMEALVRWEHPERGLVYPDQFVTLAEELGLIVPIGRWVLREACRQAKEWQERYPSDLPLMVGVNLSARELQHPTLVGDVEEALREAGLKPQWLTLEITESAVVKDEEQNIDAMGRLGALGIRFALDDFGTGYSALAYLRRLPVGLLKLDRSFVERLGEDAEAEILLSGVISIASGLGLYVLAEGVETPEQLAQVKSLGCDLAQGHYFSKPLSSEAATELLETYNPTSASAGSS